MIRHIQINRCSAWRGAVQAMIHFRHSVVCIQRCLAVLGEGLFCCFEVWWLLPSLARCLWVHLLSSGMDDWNNGWSPIFTCSSEGRRSHYKLSESQQVSFLAKWSSDFILLAVITPCAACGVPDPQLPQCCAGQQRKGSGVTERETRLYTTKKKRRFGVGLLLTKSIVWKT